MPWAVIAGYGTRDEYDGTFAITRADRGEVTLDMLGVAFGFRNRMEINIAGQELYLGTLGIALGQIGEVLRQDILGAKLRLAGDLIYTPWPQVLLGAEYKRQHDFDLPNEVGAGDDSGVDVYVAASKLIIAGMGGRTTYC